MVKVYVRNVAKNVNKDWDRFVYMSIGEIDSEFRKANIALHPGIRLGRMRRLYFEMVATYHEHPILCGLI